MLKWLKMAETAELSVRKFEAGKPEAVVLVKCAK
jgi:hypothetical protein